MNTTMIIAAAAIAILCILCVVCIVSLTKSRKNASSNIERIEAIEKDIKGFGDLISEQTEILTEKIKENEAVMSSGAGAEEIVEIEEIDGIDDLDIDGIDLDDIMEDDIPDAGSEVSGEAAADELQPSHGGRIIGYDIGRSGKKYTASELEELIKE